MLHLGYQRVPYGHIFFVTLSVEHETASSESHFHSKFKILYQLPYNLGNFIKITAQNWTVKDRSIYVIIGRWEGDLYRFLFWLRKLKLMRSLNYCKSKTREGVFHKLLANHQVNASGMSDHQGIPSGITSRPQSHSRVIDRGFTNSSCISQYKLRHFLIPSYQNNRKSDCKPSIEAHNLERDKRPWFGWSCGW